MKYEVKLSVSGQVWFFECYAQNPNDAKRVAKSQHPNARIHDVTAVYR